MTPEEMLRADNIPWHRLTPGQQEWRIALAESISHVCSEISEDQSRELYPVAWDVIDERKERNCFEVAE
jgi:hypothetical protein